MIDSMSPAAFKEARHKLGFSQSAMAAALGLSRKNTVSDYETGARSITPTIALLVEAYLAGWRPGSE